MMGLKTFEYCVKGTVQGVNFRSWTVSQAKKLNITGYVTNADSGDVTGVAEGEQDALASFKQVLQKGPSAADVADVKINNEKSIDSAQYTGFDVQ